MATLVPIDFSIVKDYERWQRFILSRHDTHCSDLAQWRPFFNELYGFKNYSYGYLEQDDFKGAFSLYHIPSPFTGNMLVSSPFFGRGGFYADSQEVREALLNKIKEIADGLGVDYVELRLTHPLPPPYQCNTDFLEFDLELLETPELVWQRSLSSNVRQNIRKAEKNGLIFSPSSDYSSCYDILSRTLRDLGTPFHGRRFFNLLVKYLKDHLVFSEVRMGNKVVAGGIVIRFKGSVITPYIGSLKKYRHYGTNYCQYWGIIQYCLEHKIKRFEFGRSRKHTTHVKFKEKWGTTRIQVYYNYYVVNPQKKYKTVTNPPYLFLLATMIWKVLPLFITRKIGPFLSRYIP